MLDNLCRLPLLALSLVALAGCGLSPGVTAAPSQTLVPSPSVIASALPTATASATSGVASCPTLAPVAPIASDTLVDAKLEPGDASDRLVLTFGTKSGQPLNPTAELIAASPPFYAGQSGNTIQVAGDRYYQLRLDGMWIAAENGEPTYEGQRDLKQSAGAIREAAMNDASEGVVSWIVGTVGNGCVSLQHDTATGERLIVEVAKVAP